MTVNETAGMKGEKGDPGMTPGARHAIIGLIVLILLMSGLALFLGARAVDGLRAGEQAQCKFDSDIGTAPVKVLAGGRPSLLGVTIISDARVAWHGLDCPGTLGKPTQTFAHWARIYHLPAG